VPIAQGRAASLNAELGLGERHTYDVVMSGPAPDAMLAAVESPALDGLGWPVPEGFMGRGFGYVRRRSIRGRLHRGVDIPAAEGSRVVAANPGLVVYSDNGVRGYGNLVVILHADDTRTVYAHLHAAYVSAGEQVVRGQAIGEVGTTGLTRAPHLHFEYLRRARPRNPVRLFVDRPSRQVEQRRMIGQQRRREASEDRLKLLRERAERRARRRARRADSET